MKVAMLTSGGDCQGLNSALRGVGKSLYKIFGKDVDIYGIRDGYRGLIYGDIRKMDPSNFSGILTLGGTILGTSRQPFKTMCLPMPEFGGKTKLDMMLENYRKYKFDCLVILGGTAPTRPQTCWRSTASTWSACPKRSTTTCGAPT